MRFFLALIAGLLISTPSFAIRSAAVDMSGSNLPTTYGTGATSLILQNIGTVNRRRVTITNTSTSQLCCNVSTFSTSIAPSSGDGELCVPGNFGKAWDDIPTNRNVYCRSNSGSPITSGFLIVEVWP